MYILEIWSEVEIQWQLKKAKSNYHLYSKIVMELVKRGYMQTVDQCRAKIKALKTKYKQGLIDGCRRSSAGRDSKEQCKADSHKLSPKTSIQHL